MKPVETDPLITVSRRAMACAFEVRFQAESCPNGTESALAALDLVESLDKRLSYFKPDSLISEINKSAGGGPVEVEPWLFDLLATAKRLFDETKGAYDVTAAPLWEVWGFARRAGKLPTDAELTEARSHVGCQFMELDPEKLTVRFRLPGMRVNLGSIGKGFALDECCRCLEESGMADFIVHGGQSSVLARGRLERAAAEKGRHEPRGWEIGIADPRRPGRRLGIIQLENRALGTTSLQFQSFRHRGRRYGHVLDPRTGLPVDGPLATTVFAPMATQADALSTAFYVMGPDDSRQFCQSHPEIGMVTIVPGRNEMEVETITSGMESADLKLERQ